MSRFIRVFLFSLVCFSLAAFLGITAYSKIFDTHPLPIPEDQVDKLNLDSDNPFDKSVLEGKRLNTLLLGVNENMTDTIMLASFNIETKDIDVISIPRDTYHHRDGYNGPAEKKINAIYNTVGIEELIDNVQEVLGEKIPIHHYAIIEYQGVKEMVDLVGGVRVDVPVDMKYEDPYDDPPLKIRLSKGVQVLDGEEAMQLLRFRKNSDGTGYINGDLGRIETQQEFVKAFAKKAIGLKLPNIIKAGIENVDTDVKMSQGISYASRLVGIESENINMVMIPGEDKYINGTSYYIHDESETKKLLRKIYNDNEEEELADEVLENERFDDDEYDKYMEKNYKKKR